MQASDDYDGIQYDTFNDGRTADYDGRRCCMCAPPERVTRPVSASGLDRMVARQLALQAVTRADMDAASMRYAAAEDLAADFGTDVSEWTV